MFRKIALSAVCLAGLTTCSSGAPPSIAKQIGARSELIGGPGALGEVGDYLLANDQIRLVIQGEGYSRGFGVYGGSLIDADLQRAGQSGNDLGGKGYDAFSEMFPAFFLKAMAPSKGGITTKTYPDGSASIIVTGTGAEFLFMLTRINDVVVPSTGLVFTNEYRLYPGKRYVEITTSVTNLGADAIKFPGDGVDALTKGVPFFLPVGDVLLFGAANKVFSPLAGFDLRFTLQDLYKTPPPLPGLPGLVTPFLATTNEHVSYGFASGVTDENTSFVKKAGYPNARPDDILVPFLFSGFTGAFYAAAPDVLESRAQFSFKKYFIVGTGDVGSIRDVVHELRGYKTGSLAAWVRSGLTQQPVEVSVVTYDASGNIYSQHHPIDGRFVGTYEPGKYSYRIVADGRFTTSPVPFEITEGKTTAITVDVDEPGSVNLRIRDVNGRPMPGKCSLVSHYVPAASGLDPMSFLYDLRVGEHRRPVDLITDKLDDEKTREYLEQVLYVGTQPKTELVRPGHYRAVCSRGVEYDLTEQDIDVTAGRLTELDVVLKQSVVTPGWISGDYHLHARHSVDSYMPYTDRITTVAAEGVDLAVATDHNYVTDYTPTIAAEELTPFIQGMVGLELTTLEIGHFNGFPLKYNPGPITKGAFAWSGRAPEALFSDLRALGSLGKDKTIVQVNHPRDAILGYLNGYNYNPDTGLPEDSTNLFLAPEGPEFGTNNFSTAFDAMEIFNGKRFDLIRSYRVPDVLPPPPLPMTIPPAGSILRDSNGKIAFPGGLDDWFVLLNQDHRITATANSDSHDTDDEAGYPRTYTPVTDDRPGSIPEIDVVAAMRSQKAMLTNGPLVFFSVGDKGMGEVADGKSGSVHVKIQVRAAGWVDVSRVTILVNGTPVREFDGDAASLANLEADIPITRDSFVLVEARGGKSMWPVVTPLEVPSVQIGDAVGGIAGAFGINLNPFGNLQPNRVGVVKPYAFTNPVYVDFDGDGAFKGPGVSAQGLRAAMEAPRSSATRQKLSEMPTLLKVFAAFNCH
ncbi:MAG: CehA/McbA family metallohydrolase [Myxococcota bacterium]